MTESELTPDPELTPEDADEPKTVIEGDPEGTADSVDNARDAAAEATDPTDVMAVDAADDDSAVRAADEAADDRAAPDSATESDDIPDGGDAEPSAAGAPDEPRAQSDEADASEDVADDAELPEGRDNAPEDSASEAVADVSAADADDAGAADAEDATVVAEVDDAPADAPRDAQADTALADETPTADPADAAEVNADAAEVNDASAEDVDDALAEATGDAQADTAMPDETPDADRAEPEAVATAAPRKVRPAKVRPARARQAAPRRVKEPRERVPGQRGALVGRLIGGTLLAAAAAAVLVGGTLLPLPQHVSAVPQQVIAPSPGTTTLVCPTDFVLTGRDAADAQRIMSAGQASTQISGAADVRTEPLQVTGAEGATMSASSTTTGGASELAGAGAISLATTDARGYAAAACRPALTESWIAGIDTSTGSTGVLLLANPGEVSATVTITVNGGGGGIVPPGGNRIVIPPGTAQAIAVAALIGTEESPVLHIHADGSPVQASVQSTVVRGLSAAGIDIESATVAATPKQIIPGVNVVSAGASATGTVVRILAPEAAGSATITVLASGTTTPVAQQQASLEKGIPADVTIPALAPGTYDIVVSGPGPIVTAAYQATGLTDKDDYAWFTAAPVLSTAASATVDSGAPATLALFNPGSADVTVTVTTTSGTQDVAVAAGTGARLPVPAGSVRIDAAGDAIHAGITYAAAGALASAAVWSPDAAAAPVTVTR